MYERMLPYKVRSSISANDEILVNPEEVDLRGKPKKIDGISSFPTTSSKSNPAQNLAENDQQIEVEEDQRDIYKDILSYIIKEAEEKNDGSENLEKSKPIKRIIWGKKCVVVKSCDWKIVYKLFDYFEKKFALKKYF